MNMIFIYPKLNTFLKERKLLLINRENEDGYCWFGVKEAIQSFCDEHNYEISSIVWQIKVKPDDNDYAKIIAKDLEDWEQQFNQLDVIFEKIEK